MDDLKIWLTELLPESAQEYVSAIVDRVATEIAESECPECAEREDGEAVERVEVAGGRLVVQTVQAYGLTLGLDALGRAVTVAHPDGLVA